MSEVQKYISKLEREKKKVLEEIASKERTLSRINVKLSDPEHHLSKELGRGSVKVSKLVGRDLAQKPKTVLKKNSSVVGAPAKTETPAAPPAAPAPDKKEEKKSGVFGGLFT